jgi:hypothetical protein
MRYFKLQQHMIGLSVAFLLTLSSAVLAQVYSDITIPYCWWEARSWDQGELPSACYPPAQSTPDTGLYNATIVGRDRFARYGYPYHNSLISGINDTLDVLINFYNPPVPENEYDLSGKKEEQWFAPQTYQTYVTSLGGQALVDSIHLGYRMRGWSNGWHKAARPTRLKAEDYGAFYVRFDVWKLPPGRFQLCVLPTDKIPPDLHAGVAGTMVEFYPAHDLADSCNGYEGCYWRAEEDSDFTTAKSWVGKILTINPKSVPGWWLKASNALEMQDTATAKSAYDTAINYLNTAADPAMPDSTKRPLFIAEKQYIDCLKAILPYNRAQLGP